MGSTIAGAGDRGRDAARWRLAWLPIPVFLILFAAASGVDPHRTFEPRFLLPTLNIVFITGVCLLVAAVAAGSHALGESHAVLLLGCGTVSFAAGSAVAGAAVLLTLASDTNVTVYNMAALLSAGCFLASAVVVLAAPPAPAQPAFSRSRLRAVVCYAAIATFIALVTVADLDGLIPPFFVAGEGATPIRQVVLGSAIAMFALAAALFRVLHRRSPSRFIDWYSLSLLLIAVGLAGVFGEQAVGGLLGWTARAAQYVGCTYMFVAVLSLPGGSHAWRISFDQKLRETERRHRSLVDVCPDAILVHADGKYVFANPAAARLFGARSAADVIGRAVLDLIHPDFRPLAAQRIQQAHGGEVTSLQEMQWLRLDGSIIDVEVTGALVQFRGRAAIQTVVRDVSKRKRAEESLQVQSDMAAELLKAGDKHAIFESLADRIYAVADGAVVAVSEFDSRHRNVTVRSVRCTPAEREVAIAHLGREPEGLSFPFADQTRARWIAGELALVPGGLSDVVFRQIPEDVCDRLACELGLGDMFGMACACEEDILGTVAILTHGRGPLPQQKLIESLVASAALALKRARVDEERKQLEQDLRASEGLLRAVTDHTTDAVYVKDRESRWLMANPALLRIVDRPAEEVLGLTDAEIYADPAIGEAILANDRQVLASAEAVAFEEAAETPQGIRWFLSTKAPMRDATGRIIGLIGISRDITERRRMEEALREADRRKTEFIAMLSHELRNPLAPIRYALPLIGKDPLSGQAASALGVVSRQVDHLVRLVDDLLDVSRITRGQIELRPAPITLESVVNRAVESASPLIDAARHRLAVRVPGEAVWMDVDPDRVSQVITNLLTNAAKYTPPGGEIVVEACRQNDQAVVRVRDNGIGIPPEVLSTLFEMFYQVKVPDRSQGGLGIGLALAKRLVEMHGGTIEARSAGIGHGAEFVVRLPVAQRVNPREVEQATPPPVGGRRLKVLVVDDNADLVEMLAIVVGALGHDVRKAVDGPGALLAAKTYRPDVVLLDLGLPGLSGLDVARELRRHPDTAHARLVALTGWGQAEDRRETREAGFDDHLTKPTDPGTLERLLSEMSQQL